MYIDSWGAGTVTLFQMALYQKTSATEWTLLESTTNDTSKPTGIIQKTLSDPVTLSRGNTYALCAVADGATFDAARKQLNALVINHDTTPLAFASAGHTSLPATLTSPGASAHIIGMGLK
jgi:hypothetical protein